LTAKKSTASASDVIGDFIESTHRKEPLLGVVASAPIKVEPPPPATSAFMQMCEAGNANNVRMCIEMGTVTVTEAQVALDRLESFTSTAHQAVYRMLKEFVLLKQA
jgi:hypothetical protein